MINYRFLNYKKYSTFELDLPQISDDSIVFIQDKSCIWARGHLYQCEGAGDANLNNGTLVFKDGLGDVVFTITLEGSDIVLRDSSGNESRASFVLREDLQHYVPFNYAEATYQKKGNYADRDYVDDTFVKKIDVYTPQYGYEPSSGESGGSGTITPVYYAVDSLLSTFSANPVLNRVVTIELNKKVDRSELSQLATKDELETKANVSSLADYITYQNADLRYQPKGDYATVSMLEDYVKRIEVYTPKQGESPSDGTSDTGDIDSPGTTVIQPVNIIVDSELSLISSNPVLNRIITTALNDKADRSELSLLATKDELSNKLDVSVIDNYASKIDLVPYLKINDAARIYLPKGDYITESQAADTYQPKGDYLTPSDIEVIECNCPKLVTLTVQQYLTLVDNNEVSANTYYFTYEEKSATWGFGDQFPITLS